jgi:hypothetical protein
MLKITTRTDPTATIFELEGKLAGPWVQELEASWREATDSDRAVRVMLCAVTFIDDKGRISWLRYIGGIDLPMP